MKTAAKVLAILVGIIVVIALVSSLLVNLLFDPNQYRAEISKLIEEKTGRGFQIHGDIDFNFFPWLGLKANDLELANVDSFGDGPFATIDRIKLRVRLLPLLKKELDIGRISVGGLKLNLEQHRDGQNNWQGLLPGRSIVTTKQAVTLDAKAAMGAAFVATSVGGLDLKNSRISWVDEKTGTNILADALRIHSGTMRPGKPFDVQWEFNFRNQTSRLTGQCKLTTTTTADLEHGTLQMQNTVIQVKLDQSAQFPEPIEVQGKADILVEPGNNRLQLNELRLGTGGMVLNGHLQIKNLGKNSHTTGELSSNTFNLKRVLRQFGRQLPARSDPKAFEQVAIQCSVDAFSGRLLLDSCQGTLDQTGFSGQLEFNPESDPIVRFDLELDRIDLDRYGASPDVAAPKPETPDSQEPAADSSTRQLDRHPTARWWHRLLGPLLLDAAAASGNPEETAAAPEPAAETGTAAGSSTAPSTTGTAGKGIPVEGNLRIGALTFRKIRARNLSTRLLFSTGTLELEPLHVELYGGTLEGALHWQKESDPGWRTKFHLIGVDLGKLLQDLNPSASFAAVAEDIRGTLAAQGATREDAKRTLAGKVQLRLTQVKGAGFDINQAIVNATPALQGKLPDWSNRPQSVVLDRLSSQLIATKGLIELNQVVGKSRNLKLTGNGKIDLPRDRLAILLLATMLGNNDQNPAVPALVGVPIPIRVTGTLAKPIVSLDLRDVLHNVKDTKQAERKEKAQKRRDLRRTGKRGFGRRSD